MKYLLIFWFILSPGVALAATHSVVTSDDQESMLTYMAQREGKTNLQKVREFCAAGFAPAREQYRKLVEEGRTGALKQMTPAARAIVCEQYASVGAPCPAEEP